MSQRHSIAIANDEMLTELIGSARRRLVALAPAFSRQVAESIRERWIALGANAASVVLDVDPEVYRLGFGDFAATQLLEDTAAQLGSTLNRQDGIRIGLIIADDTTVVYSPTALLVEAGPENTDTPNAIFLGQPPEALARDLGQGPNGIRDQIVGLDKAEKAKLQEVKADLDRNPPQRFDIARTVRVFNAYFEFVDFELRGLQIQNRKAPIPPDLMGLAQDPKTQRKIHTTFNLIDESSKLSGKQFQDKKKQLVNDYLTQLPGYGYVVLRGVKPEFEEKVDELKKEILEFQNEVKDDLAQAIQDSCKSLTEALLPAVISSPPKRWKKHYTGNIPAGLARRLLEDDLQHAFHTVDALINDMKVKLVFKGVTHELLQDEEFQKLAKEKLPSLEHLSHEFDAARATGSKNSQLFGE